MSEASNAFVGGEPGRAQTPGGRAPGATGFADALVAAVPAAAAVAVELYRPAVLEGLPPPADGDLAERVGPIFDRYNLAVPQANAAFHHLARIDAMQLQLGVRDLGRFAAALVARLGEAGTLIGERQLAVATPSTPLGRELAAAIAANHAMMSAYMRYQVALVSAREAPVSPEAKTAMRGHAQAAHRAFAAVIDTPFAIPGALREAPLVTAPAIEAVTAALAAVRAVLEPAEGTDAANAAMALDALSSALTTWRRQAERVQAAVVARRRAARELGDALDGAAGVPGRDRFATVAVLVAQVREALAVGGAVRAALPAAADLSALPDETTLAPIAAAIGRYDEIWQRLTVALGGVESAAQAVLGAY